MSIESAWSIGNTVAGFTDADRSHTKTAGCRASAAQFAAEACETGLWARGERPLATACF